MIHVNKQKLERAKVIVELVLGDRVPQDSMEQERQERFTAHIRENKDLKMTKDAKDREAMVHFVYVLLGGLVRTEEQQKKAEIKKKTMQNRKGKKQM
jgi:hypothetical protein|tara:strand:- start:1419 stop:1709 length:291 start_codon:yes stop_codon:yes gene_type:complete